MEINQFIKELHNGNIKTDQVGRGMHLCYRNACDLIEDAEFLLQRRPERSVSLAILALEEIGKLYALCNAIMETEQKEISWSELENLLKLKSHKQKLFNFSGYGKSFLKNKFEEIPDGIVPLLDKFKQLGFYVNFIKDNFYSPSQFGAENKEWAEWLISIAKERIKSLEHMHETEQSSSKIVNNLSLLIGMAQGVNTEDEFHEIFMEWLKKIKNS